MAYAKKSQKSTLSEKGIKRTIVTVIILAILMVILAVLAYIFYTPERIVKLKIENIATDYYENFFYQDIVKYKTTESQLTATMQKYEQKGFAKVALQQLLLYDNQKHADAASTLKEYCDETQTYITIYPEYPYGQKDYRIDYNYSCEF